MIDLAKLQSDVAKAISDMPSQLVYNGQIISVSVSPVNQQDDVADDGILNEADLEAVAVKGFQVPRVREPVEIIGEGAGKYFVDRITTDESAVHLFLRRA